MRIYSKPLYLFTKEVPVYSDLTANGPSDAMEIRQRVARISREDITLILRDLLLRGVVTKIRVRKKSLFAAKYTDKPRIVKRPGES